MDSSRRKQKQLRRQVVLNTLVRTKSRVRVEVMPPLLEDPKEDCVAQDSDVPHDHLVFNCDSPLHHAVSKGGGGVKESVKRDRNQSVLIEQYGNSGRWRLITAVPELNHQVSSRRKKDEAGKDLNEGLRGKRETQSGGTSGRFGCGFFRAAVSACKACHAMEPSRREDELLRENMV